MLQNSDVILIDEGLSQVDVSKERIILKNILKNYSGKIIIFVTHRLDNVDLFNFALSELPLADWNLLASTYDLHNDEKLNKGNVMTEYEEKFSSKGNPICKYIINYNF